MKLPRDLSANQLIKALRVLGYSIDHQRGSHIRIVSQLNGLHHETIPNQDRHADSHSSEHRQTPQCRHRRPAVAIGFVRRLEMMRAASSEICRPFTDEFAHCRSLEPVLWSTLARTAGKMLSRLARKALQPSTATENLERRNGVPIIRACGEIITSEHVRRLMDEEGI